MTQNRRGQFITIEGIDGAGKSTQVQALLRFGRTLGIDWVHTREPGGTPVGEKIRGLLLHEDMSIRTETMLFFAARAEHVQKVIAPALARGQWVFSDRFTDATYAYQVGAKGFSAARCLALERWTLGDFCPDWTIVLDLPPRVAAYRRAQRRPAADRFENEALDFFARVRQAYLRRVAMAPERYCVVDATKTPERMQRMIRREMLKKWPYIRG